MEGRDEAGCGALGMVEDDIYISTEVFWKPLERIGGP